MPSERVSSTIQETPDPQTTRRLAVTSNENVVWLNKQKIEQAAATLRKHGFNVIAVDTKEEARKLAIEMIPASAKVGVGGSITIREIGLLDALIARGNMVVHHWYAGLSPEDDVALRREELLCDVFLSSANAITLTGEIVNIDGAGNRVGAMAFGPGKVIVIAGVNKIVKDVTAGIWRAKNQAAALNAHRAGYDVPCGKIGRCIECDSPNRICRVTTIIERRPSRTDFTLILVADDIGF